MIKKILLLLFVVSISSLWAQQTSFIYEGIEFSGVGKNSIQVNYIQKGQNTVSHARVIDYSPIEVRHSDSTLTVISGDLKAILNKSDQTIDFKFFEKLLIADRSRSYSDGGLEITFDISQDEALFGGGERVLGMNRRGNKLYNYNRAHYGYETRSELMNFTMPIVMSSNLYMLHFDNPVVAHIDLDSKGDNSVVYDAEGGPIRYQVIAGESWGNILDQYTAFSGRQPMIPRWALGNFASRFGYHSQQEVMETIDAFQQEQIPVDAVILDLYWFGKDIKGHMGNLAFDKEAFPDPKAMIDELAQKDIKTVLITEPFVLTSSNRWQEAVDGNVLGINADGNPLTYDFYFGNTGLIDVFAPQAKSWFWDIYKSFTEMGVAGWWGDLGEPEVHPEAMIHYGGRRANEVHNIFGNEWAKIIQEGYQKDFQDKRAFILMRSGYSGAQRYGMLPWSGDVNRTWGGLQAQTEIALQMGMQGMAFFHSDLGGFAGANLDDELYVRWLQYGVFNPIFRPHAQEEVPSEPVYRSEKAKSLAKSAIELRYALLPYNYTTVYQNHKSGIPLMRPLFFENSSDRSLYEDASTYFWGDSFFIKPVVESGQEFSELNLPKNSDWFDFYTDQFLAGGSELQIRLQEDKIPTYVRSGSFLPMKTGMQSTADYNLTSFDLHFYKGHEEQSSGELYIDDGKSPNPLEKDAFELIQFSSKQENGPLEIRIDSYVGKNYTSDSKTVTLIIHNWEKKPKEVQVNGLAQKFTYQRKTELLKIEFNLTPGENTTINIQ